MWAWCSSGYKHLSSQGDLHGDSCTPVSLRLNSLWDVSLWSRPSNIFCTYISQNMGSYLDHFIFFIDTLASAPDESDYRQNASRFKGCSPHIYNWSYWHLNSVHHGFTSSYACILYICSHVMLPMSYTMVLFMYYVLSSVYLIFTLFCMPWTFTLHVHCYTSFLPLWINGYTFTLCYSLPHSKSQTFIIFWVLFMETSGV